jgi:putative transposase
MRGPKAPAVLLTPQQLTILQQLVRSRSGPHYLALRARLILLAADGLSNVAISRQLALSLPTVRLWRNRWRAGTDRLLAHSIQYPDQASGPIPPTPPPTPTLTELITKLLADIPRPGAPPTFSSEQLVQIVALACEDPQDSERPTSHWSPREVADEAVKRGIVQAISVRSVARFLKSGRSATPSEPLLVDPQARRSSGVPAAGNHRV